MWYVYVLRSGKKKDLFIGSTDDLDRVMAEHASGFYDETADAGQLTCEVYIGVSTKKQAKALEKYLKSKEGNIILKKQMLQRK